MNKRVKFFLLFFLFSLLHYGQALIHAKGTSVESRLLLPEGFEREKYPDNSFSAFLRSFKLQQHEAAVYLHTGEKKYRQDVHAAVLDIDVGKKDLQQCADAVMRLRAEYFYRAGLYDKISFNFTNGFKAEFSKWRKGYRIKISGNTCAWYMGAAPSDSRETFMAYLEKVFSYAGTLSLAKELKAKKVADLKPGDVFIMGGSPGHAVIVMDVAVNKTTGEKIFCLAQSYMPAQSIHILNNFNNEKLSPWYSLQEGETLKTPEWTFTAGTLKCFEE